MSSAEEEVRSAEERAIEMFKIKKLIKSLERARGYVLSCGCARRACTRVRTHACEWRLHAVLRVHGALCVTACRARVFASCVLFAVSRKTRLERETLLLLCAPPTQSPTHRTLHFLDACVCVIVCVRARAVGLVQ